MSLTNFKKNLIYQFKKIKKHKNKIKNIKIHNFRFKKEYKSTQEHEPKSQELKNTKFLGIQHLSQKITPNTKKIHI